MCQVALGKAEEDERETQPLNALDSKWRGHFERVIQTLDSEEQMKTYAKRHFLDCRSLAEMAVTWVVLSVMFILPVSAASLVLGFVLELPETVSRFIPLGMWFLSIVGMWLWFVRLGRTWAEPRLATKEFFYFQAAAAVFVLLLGLAFPWAEAASSINAIRWFLSALFVMINVAYVTLAWGIRLRLPAKILAGLLLNVAVALMPIWIK